MAEACIFCRIIAGEIPGQFVYEGDTVVAFRDINPVAPTHLLVVPREHIDSVAALQPGDQDLAGQLLQACAQVARAAGLEERGYRVVANIGPDSGNQVPHLHLHILGGRQLHGMG